jgi:hypothetical protein
VCAPCQVTSYRGVGDVGCQVCSKDDGQRCEVEGSVFPSAAPGFFAELGKTLGHDTANTTLVMPCLPFQACLGTCGNSADTEQLLQKESAEESEVTFDDCPAGLGTISTWGSHARKM